MQALLESDVRRFDVPRFKQLQPCCVPSAHGLLYAEVYYAGVAVYFYPLEFLSGRIVLFYPTRINNFLGYFIRTRDIISGIKFKYNNSIRGGGIVYPYFSTEYPRSGYFICQP